MCWVYSSYHRYNAGHLTEYKDQTEECREQHDRGHETIAAIYRPRVGGDRGEGWRKCLETRWVQVVPPLAPHTLRVLFCESHTQLLNRSTFAMYVLLQLPEQIPEVHLWSKLF